MLWDLSEKAPSSQAEACHGDPVWEESTGKFWCATNLNAYDLPDGGEWQHLFAEAVEKCSQAEPRRKALQRHVSDAPAPLPERAGRKLARFPSDPDKRRIRAAHSAALLQMPCLAGRQVFVQGRLVAFFRFGGSLYAVSGKCPHQGATLCEGEIGDMEDMVDGHRRFITCPVHKMKFDLSSGEVIDGDCEKLQTFAVRIRDLDEARRIATIEVGFDSLTAEYFGDSMQMDA